MISPFLISVSGYPEYFLTNFPSITILNYLLIRSWKVKNTDSSCAEMTIDNANLSYACSTGRGTFSILFYLQRAIPSQTVGVPRHPGSLAPLFAPDCNQTLNSSYASVKPGWPTGIGRQGYFVSTDICSVIYGSEVILIHTKISVFGYGSRCLYKV